MHKTGISHKTLENKALFRLSAQIFVQIRSYLDSLNGNELHEIRFVQIRFELHSYVIWITIQIAFQEIC